MDAEQAKGSGNHLLLWLRRTLTVEEAATTAGFPARLLWVGTMLFFLAFGVRLLHWHDLRVEIGQETSNLTSLFKIYRKEVKRMTADGILFPNKPVDRGDVTMLVHPPAYSILVMGLYGTEESRNQHLALRMLQVFLDSLSVVVVFLIAAELLPLGLAVTAALLAAVSPHLAYYSLWLSPDSLVVPPILLAVYLLLRARRRPRLFLYLAAGALFGLACWLRSNPLLMAPLFALVVFFTVERARRWRYAFAVVMAMAAVISPITIRNYVVYGRFIPLTIVTGMNLVQGIAEFDKEKRFDMPLADADVSQKDVEWHNRPDYRSYLWYPDGIERDQYRFRRGLEVIKQNPGWFARVMLARMSLMLRYNDQRPQPVWVFQSTAPVLSSSPGFGHDLQGGAEGQPAWQVSSQEMLGQEMIAKMEEGPSPVRASYHEAGWLEVKSSGYVERVISLPVPVREGTDYAMLVPVRIEQGSANLSVRAEGSGDMLQSYSVVARAAAEAPGDEGDVVLVPLLFASRKNNTVNFVISCTSEEHETSLQVKEARLFDIGATPQQWTNPFRAILRAAQKNIFKTGWMRLLIALGVLCLMLAGRHYALAMLLAAPLYYLCTHAPFSTEYRYVLTIHYFLFIVIAAALYVAAKGFAQGIKEAAGHLRRRGAATSARV